MKRMLFNATQQEELRVAIVDGQKLIDIDIETTGREQRKSNIYKGIITRIEPSLEACFVNYGEERHGFLPFKEVARTYFREGCDVRTASIKDALREGQEIVVQVEKEERGNKGAALTSFISLAGRYLVLMPNNPRGGGVSRRVEGEDRQELRETMDKLDLPAGMSVIARTAGIGRGVDELQWDLNYLMQLWRAIEGAGQSASGAFLIYQESSLVIRAIRDYFQPDIGEILIDTDDIYEQAQQFMAHVMPDMVHRVKRYRDDVPLFSRFQIEHQIESAYSRTVPLPSGGAIVIDHTEALVSIDVNSARATRGADIETTALNTNLEAADEVARQLRLRDLGGPIVIDFIDMENAKNQREVETRLKDALRYDRARVQMGKISRFGLMELSRQRLRPSLSEGSHVTCPRCNGTGHIRDTESSALQVLRIVQEEAMKENSAAIHVQAPVDVAAFLLNEKRGEILKIENRHRVVVILIPNKHLETPHYKLERIKHDDPRLEDAQPSYDMVEEADTDIGYDKRQKEEVKPRQEAVVKGITPDQPAPIVERKPATPPPVPVVQAPEAETGEQGFFSRMFGFFRKKPVTPAVAPAPVVEEKEKPQAIRERTERNGRGPRNRNRTPRRDRNEEGRTDAIAETIKQAQSAATEAQSLQRPPREPRPPRQPRAPRENVEARGGEIRTAEPRNEPRRERNVADAGTAERPRRQREERKDAAVEEQLLNQGNGAPASVFEPVASAPAFQPNVNLEPGLEAQSETGFGEEESADGEEPRRRRRRGGRNRNRRDRESGELVSATEGENTETESVITEVAVSHAEVVSVTEKVFHTDEPAAAAFTPAETPARTAEIASDEAVTAPDVAPEIASVEEVASAPEAVAPTASPAPVSETSTAAASAAPAAVSETVATKEADRAPMTDAVSATAASTEAAPVAPAPSEVQPVTEAPVSTRPATAAAPAAAEAPVASVAPEAVPSAAPASIAEAPAAEVQAAAVPAAEVPVAAVPATVTPVEATEKPAPAAAPAKSAVQVDHLRDVLAEAGLTLAITDPEKLRVAQEAAAQIVAPPRMPRERKPAPPASTEPLVQVETRR